MMPLKIDKILVHIRQSIYTRDIINHNNILFPSIILIKMYKKFLI